MKPTYILLAIFSLCGVVVAQQETASITSQARSWIRQGAPLPAPRSP